MVNGEESEHCKEKLTSIHEAVTRQESFKFFWNWAKIRSRRTRIHTNSPLLCPTFWRNGVRLSAADRP